MEEISQPLIPARLIYGRQIATTANRHQFKVTRTVEVFNKHARYQFMILSEFKICWRTEYLLGLS